MEGGKTGEPEKDLKAKKEPNEQATLLHMYNSESSRTLKKTIIDIKEGKDVSPTKSMSSNIWPSDSEIEFKI